MIVQKLEGKNIRLLIEEQSNNNIQKIEIKDRKIWIPLINSFDMRNTLNFIEGNLKFSKKLKFQTRTSDSLIYQFEDSQIFIKSEITLKESNLFHISYFLNPKTELQISKITASYEILLGNDPDFTWVPHVIPRKNYVVGDHVFRSPVLIYGKKNLYIAFIPDLEILGKIRPIQSFLDFSLVDRPYLSFGFGNYSPIKHFIFKHNPKILSILKPNVEIKFGYYIKIFNTSSVLNVLKEVNSFLWNSFGRKLLYNELTPQILPYDQNVNEGFKSIFERHKVWCNFELGGLDCGGFWQKVVLGKENFPFRFLNSENLKTIIKLEHKSTTPIEKTIAVIWNNTWFMNARSAYSLTYFGKIWNNSDLIEKGKRIINTVLKLPRTKGLFPSLIYPESCNSNKISTINGLKAFIHSDDFHIVDSALVMYWLLKYYQDFDENNNEILEKSKLLVDLIKSIQLKNGSIPTFLNFKDNLSNPILRDELLDSASSGASMMFLLEYYKVKGGKEIIEICESIAKFILNDIIPFDKWHDFEVFYSCTNIPFKAYDKRSKSHYMNTLCIYWCAEGFKELYKVTNEIKYLEAGERILNVLSLFQQVWNMPYISFNTFGGFCSQNSDAELSDARQALFVRTYMEYYLETGNKEYMERGIAALRASWALQLLPEYQEICPGNFDGLLTFNGIDKGGILENYGHMGKDVQIQSLIEFDWGIGSAATATAYTKNHFGDIFIDFQLNLIWGIDGILIKSFNFNKEDVNIEFEVIERKKDIIIKSRANPIKPVKIFLNNILLGNTEDLTQHNKNIFKLD